LEQFSNTLIWIYENFFALKGVSVNSNQVRIDQSLKKGLKATSLPLTTKIKATEKMLSEVLN